MDAVEFLKEWKRMCDKNMEYNKNIGEKYCKEDCPIIQIRKTSYCISCQDAVLGNPVESIQSIEKWSKEHPRKTRLQDFLEKYPKAPLTLDGMKTPKACAQQLGYCESCHYVGGGCYNCWNEPVED